MPNFLLVKHSPYAGFFSCCFIRLCEIINYFNTHRKLPDKVFGNDLFQMYKTPETSKEDWTEHFFIDEKTMNIDIPYKTPIRVSEADEETQFSDYSKINFKRIAPLIERYFTPSRQVFEKLQQLKQKYKLNPSEFCGIRYRGTDKVQETNKPSYEDFIMKAREYKILNPNTPFLVLTDEPEFLVKFKKEFQNVIAFEETNTTINSLETAQWYLAAIYAMSKCRNIICTSGNGELFMSFYRGGADGIIQYLNRKETIYGTLNPHYREVTNPDDCWLYEKN